MKPGESLQLLISDVASARQSIVIRASYVGQQHLKSVLPPLTDACNRGVKAFVQIKRPQGEGPTFRAQEAIRLLEIAGCKTAQTEDSAVESAIIDNKLIWFGGLPLLTPCFRETGSLRCEQKEIARLLLTE